MAPELPKTLHLFWDVIILSVDAAPFSRRLLIGAGPCAMMAAACVLSFRGGRPLAVSPFSVLACGILCSSLSFRAALWSPEGLLDLIPPAGSGCRPGGPLHSPDCEILCAALDIAVQLHLAPAGQHSSSSKVQEELNVRVYLLGNENTELTKAVLGNRQRR